MVNMLEDQWIFFTNAEMRFGQAIFATQKSLVKSLITGAQFLAFFHMATENYCSLAALPCEVYKKLASSESESNISQQELSGKQMSEKKDVPPTILVIEPDNDTCRLLKHNLQHRGYRVVVALEEEDAIALACGRRDRPDLILLSQVELSIDEFINMGRRIRQGAELYTNTPIIVMAEQYGDDMEGKDVKVGESEYVTYLEDGEQLMNLLHRLCRV